MLAMPTPPIAETRPLLVSHHNTDRSKRHYTKPDHNIGRRGLGFGSLDLGFGRLRLQLEILLLEMQDVRFLLFDRIRQERPHRFPSTFGSIGSVLPARTFSQVLFAMWLHGRFNG